MINLANRLYRIDFKSKILRKLRVDSVLRVLVRNLFNIVIPFYYAVTKKEALNKVKRDTQVIVSLTSFPLRIGRLWIVVESLLRQSEKPDKIVLWLSRAQFPNELDDLPNRLQSQMKRGLEIQFVDEDIRSYKKFYYAFLKYTNDIIITVDDDIMYPDYMISDLYDLYKTNMKSVVARYCYEMKSDKNGLLSYKDWKFVSLYEDYKSSELFFGSGGGVLFPPQSYSREIFNKDMFLRICSKADDVWLNAMVRLKGTPIVKVKRPTVILPVLIKQDLKLFTTNIFDNDKYLKAVQEQYGKIFVKN